ncbi:MAG: 4Fe-4S double cluster binding domain-containing protein [Bacteroidota bacterium]
MISEIIKKNLIPPADFIFGFADLKGLINKKFNGFHYGISIGKRLDDKIIDDIKEGPTIEYFNHYNQVNRELSTLTKNIQADLKRAGAEALSLDPTVTAGSEAYNDEYLKTLTVDISHKMVATRAGLGWIGKSDLFISRIFGPRLRLVSLLLKENPGVNSKPVDESECGKCNICVVNCPAQAITGKPWNINIQRSDFFDAFRCREKCNELARERLNVDARICGLCIAICPYGKSK